jgi:hypothetical protein
MSTINITKEAMKAETKLRNIRKRATRAVQETQQKWEDREKGYLSTLSADVRSVLIAAGAIYAPVLKEAWVDVDPEPIPETLS